MMISRRIRIKIVEVSAVMLLFAAMPTVIAAQEAGSVKANLGGTR